MSLFYFKFGFILKYRSEAKKKIQTTPLSYPFIVTVLIGGRPIRVASFLSKSRCPANITYKYQLYFAVIFSKVPTVRLFISRIDSVVNFSLIPRLIKLPRVILKYSSAIVAKWCVLIFFRYNQNYSISISFIYCRQFSFC